MEKEDAEKELRDLLIKKNAIDARILELKNGLHIKSAREKLLSSQELKKFLIYDPDTGVFTDIESGKRLGRVGSDGYRRIQIKWLNLYFMEHRLAFLYMTELWPKYLVNHINDVRDDNRWCNLQHVTWALNNLKRKLSSANTSGHKGVSLHKSGRWRASLVSNNQQIYHRLFATKEEAAAAYATAFKKHYGFPMEAVASAVTH